MFAKNLQLNELTISTDGAIISYINKAIYHHYIALSKAKRHQLPTVSIESQTDYDPLQFDTAFSESDTYNNLLLAYCRDAAFLLHLHRPRHHPLLYQIQKTIRTQIRRIHPLQHPHLQLLLPRLPLMNLSSRHLVMCFRRVLPPKMNKFPYFLIMKRKNPILLYIPKLWDVFSIPLCKAPKIFL